MPVTEAIRYRVRYPTDGAELGSAAFVNQVFERNRAKFGKTRHSGARPMREADWSGLRVLRDLRDEVIIPTAGVSVAEVPWGVVSLDQRICQP